MRDILFDADMPSTRAQVRTTFRVAATRFEAKATQLGTSAESAQGQGGTVKFEEQRGSWVVSTNHPVKIAEVPSAVGSYVGSDATEVPDTAKCDIRLNERWHVAPNGCLESMDAVVFGAKSTN
ncbi:hypothetical protein [Rhodococcus sp. JG-3]|uniref:hypothetical protein n=1 Tax=Rhodococcus sp. JG-3 TaxID=1305835 RepID=UPI0012693A96|nr:hypothetical protein [Rhodococcus sp. JG-3]